MVGSRTSGLQRAKATIALAVALVLATTAAACQDEDQGSESKTLRVAFSASQGSLDPDVFYFAEGAMVTTSCYEGLLRYKDNTAEIVPGLAKSYKVSADRKTYTFRLRPGVKFHDGSPLTSSVFKFDIERRKAVGQGPSYMVSKVSRVETPDPLTLVIHLSEVVDPFLHYQASTYGLKAISEKAIKAHQSGDDQAEKWLGTHCAGTGPYTLTRVIPDQSYEMSAFSEYWGKKPYYSKVVIKQIPDTSTQQLQLRSGALDVMSHGYTPLQAAELATDPKLQVVTRPSISTVTLGLNLHKPPLTDIDVRRAVGMALDRKSLVETVYGDTATLYSSQAAPGTLPKEYGGEYTTRHDPKAAKAIVDKLPESQRRLELAYQNSDVTLGQLAGLAADQLRQVGFDVRSNGVPEATTFTWHTAPESKRPSMALLGGQADDASPAAQPLITLVSDPKQGIGPFTPYDPAADRWLYAGIRERSPEKAIELYGRAMNMYADLETFIPLTNLKMVIAAQKGICGIASQRQVTYLLNLAALRGDC